MFNTYELAPVEYNITNNSNNWGSCPICKQATGSLVGSFVHLECPICMEEYDKMESLICGHMLCVKCCIKIGIRPCVHELVNQKIRLIKERDDLNELTEKHYKKINRIEFLLLLLFNIIIILIGNIIKNKIIIITQKILNNIGQCEITEKIYYTLINNNKNVFSITEINRITFLLLLLFNIIFLIRYITKGSEMCDYFYFFLFIFLMTYNYKYKSLSYVFEWCIIISFCVYF